MSHVRPIELTPRAERDLRRLDPSVRRRVLAALEELAAGAENLDVVPLAGHRPWKRLRVGDYRVVHRDAQRAQGEPSGGYVVARVVHRRDLERAVERLDVTCGQASQGRLWSP